MKKTTLTIPYEDLSVILDIIGDWIQNHKEEKDIKKKERIYFRLIDLWGNNASKQISSEFESYSRQDKYDLPNEDFNALIICSFRYALGRSSYMPSWISDIISANKDYITNNTINIMIEEIETAPYYGDDCDKRMWFDLKQELEEFVEKRK